MPIHLRCLLIMILAVSVVRAQGTDPKGTLDWPTTWTIFTPVDRYDAVLDQEVLATIPEVIELPATDKLPARTITARTIAVEPGVPFDFSPIFGELKAYNVAYAFVELNSPREQTVTLGMGADWWLQAWLNGQPLFDTLESGNEAAPVGISNHLVDARLRAGRNVLAVRYITGKASAQLALGGPQQFAAEAERLAALANARSLNELPERFADRLVFPVDSQAIATASMDIAFPYRRDDLGQGALVGLQPMPRRQLFLKTAQGRKPEILDTLQRTFPEPVTLQLGKYQIAPEDLHLDVLLWTTPPEGQQFTGDLEIQLKDGDGRTMSRQTIDSLSPTGWFFALGIPAELPAGRASVEAIWRRGDDIIGRAEQPFELLPSSNVTISGRIPLRILNEPGVTLPKAPMTLGVPFPRGALSDPSKVRLVDEQGLELPLQVKETARWSRFGSVKWLLCDFTIDLAGQPREVFLEYGPQVERAVRQLERSVSLPFAYQAFVQHEDGRRFLAAPLDEVEADGPVKVMHRGTGWYSDAESGDRFCQYVTRVAQYHGSPIARLFHTWIFTGDGNRDRIREMGMRFDTVQPLSDTAFLTSFDGGEWVSADHLVQHDYQAYRLAGQEVAIDGRTPGVLTGMTGGKRMAFGAKDFWQNFPSELAVDDEGFTFFNWPRHNPPASYGQPITTGTAHLHRWAHEGELLDFRLPDEYAEDPIWSHMSHGREKHWLKGRPETANAQGVARTEEFFLYVGDGETSREEVARIMEGLNNETIRAVVDPAWLAASGVFGDIHHRDTETYPDDEHLYEQVVKAPSRWNDRLGFYGKWLYGDVPAWGIDFENRRVALYRAIRKRHHGWPVVWLPFARSGDPELYKIAEASTLQQIDAQFCHFASEGVDASVGPELSRQQGYWQRSLLPWAGKNGPVGRSYSTDTDFLWQGYHLTGNPRYRDILLLFARLTQQHHQSTRGPRTSESLLSSYIDMYEGTFDPWFLAATHTMADLHTVLFDQEEPVDPLTHQTVGHFWRHADIDFHRFSGEAGYRQIAYNNAASWSSPSAYSGGGLWPRLALPLITQAAYAWKLSKKPIHLARVAAYLDLVRFQVYDGEVAYARGTTSQAGTARGIFTGYYIRQFPQALWAFEQAGQRPEPIPNPIFLMADQVEAEAPDTYAFALPPVFVRQAADHPLHLSFEAHSRDDEQHYDYAIPEAELSGQWRLGQPHLLQLPATPESRVLRVQLSGQVPLSGNDSDRSRTMRRHGMVVMPLADPGTPEVMEFPRTEQGTPVRPMRGEMQAWFQVPDDLSEFQVTFNIGTGNVNRLTVWNPAGERAWDHHYYHLDRQPDMQVTIQVPPEHAGKLWRITGGPFVLDPAIPPYISISRAKWFNPEDTP